MELGRFSVSLAVKDLPTSRAFYEHLGFTQVAGEPDKGWIILQNGEAKIGLFQGMFESNILTFNPKDARGIERALSEKGVAITTRTTGDSGPTHLMVTDPDGNTILIDQHDE